MVPVISGVELLELPMTRLGFGPTVLVASFDPFSSWNWRQMKDKLLDWGPAIVRHWQRHAHIPRYRKYFLISRPIHFKGFTADVLLVCKVHHVLALGDKCLILALDLAIFNMTRHHAWSAKRWWKSHPHFSHNIITITTHSPSKNQDALELRFNLEKLASFSKCVLGVASLPSCSTSTSSFLFSRSALRSELGSSWPAKALKAHERVKLDLTCLS